MLARTQVLDYFEDQQHVKDDCIFFDGKVHVSRFREKEPWTESLEMDTPRGYAGEYLTGTRGEFLRDFPELGFFRDIVFMLKTLMAPSGCITRNQA